MLATHIKVLEIERRPTITSVMTGALEMICVFDRHYGLKTHFSSKKLLFGRFIGQKVRFQTIVPVKKTCHLRIWGKSPFDFQNFEKILRHILKYRNCSNLEGSLLSWKSRRICFQINQVTRHGMDVLKVAHSVPILHILVGHFSDFGAQWGE